MKLEVTKMGCAHFLTSPVLLTSLATEKRLNGTLVLHEYT